MRLEEGEAGLRNAPFHSSGSSMDAAQKRQTSSRSMQTQALGKDAYHDEDWSGHLSRLVTTFDSNDFRTHIRVRWRGAPRTLLTASLSLNSNVSADLQPPTSNLYTMLPFHDMTIPHHYYHFSLGRLHQFQ